ncbi:SGNH/GDSL hydrolase family protein [Nitrospirillum sp. BR 11828]|uniref:SGNH/GDSL hydrolase family protein n=1 Tax=Nitrospirillum sp. BR 11828 TaxID=3104325 RepID=UPI002AC9F5D8|nr:SGNH/GDSL hydrolase family protein [Nitrospirillum sp. BR 11828]MDZ5650188.1 SGNH/GDSL hydrolase family protein [Nitrospirillum sp. BR 11828]
MRRSLLLTMLAAAGVIAGLCPGAWAKGETAGWITTWASSPSLPIEKLPLPFWKPAPEVQGTVRYTLRISAGGDQLRVRLSAETLPQDLLVDHATVAVADAQGRVAPGAFRTLTFGGARAVRVPAGAPLVSDPLDLPLDAGAVLVVSLHLPQTVTVPQADNNHHTDTLPGDDRTEAVALDGARGEDAREIVSALLVHSGAKARTIVAFGDSITDGFGAKDRLMRGWPDQLAALLRAKGLRDIGIANAGIGGNRILRGEVGPSALARFDRDVLAVPGVTDVILLEGINDLGLSGLPTLRTSATHPVVTAEDIIAGYRQLIDRARARHLRVHGATLTPAIGSTFPGYATPEKDAVRQKINVWIRTSGAFDDVIDFDAAVRDPAHPERIRADYDCGDHLHPSDAGYRAMAEAALAVIAP